MGLLLSLVCLFFLCISFSFLFFAPFVGFVLCRFSNALFLHLSRCFVGLSFFLSCLVSRNNKYKVEWWNVDIFMPKLINQTDTSSTVGTCLFFVSFHLTSLQIFSPFTFSIPLKHFAKTKHTFVSPFSTRFFFLLAESISFHATLRCVDTHTNNVAFLQKFFIMCKHVVIEHQFHDG